MSDMAEWIIEQGLEAEAEHDRDGCDMSPCHICHDRASAKRAAAQRARRAAKREIA